MVFFYDNKKYEGETAVEIVRQIEGGSREYPNQGAPVKEFLDWSLSRLADLIHNRELETSPHLSEEMLAFNYLCLLDEHRLGFLSDTSVASKST